MAETEGNGFPVEGMALTHLFVVREVERSKRFYLDVLGARVYREYGGTSVVLQLLDDWLLLVSEGEPTADKPEVAFRPPSDPDRVSSEMIFRVPDCRKAYEVLRSRGAEFLTPPYDWGEEVRCFFRDPDGNLLEISEIRSSK